MPALDAFPKAHQVTFKYYVGVIYFLEENYEEVRKRKSSNQRQDADPPSSPRDTSPKLGSYATKTRSATKSECKPSNTSIRVSSRVIIHTTTTNNPQAHPHLSHPMPPSHHSHPPHPRPPVALPSAAETIPTTLPLYQKGRPIRLRRRPHRRRRRIRKTPHLPHPRTWSRHSLTKSAAKSFHRRRLRRSKRPLHNACPTNENPRR
jgi:hypothetical protein